MIGQPAANRLQAVIDPVFPIMNVHAAENLGESAGRNAERHCDGWRIQLIHYADSKSKGFGNYLQILGILAFLTGPALFGIFIVFRVRSEALFDSSMGLLAIGLVLAFGGLWLGSKQKRKGWETVSANCVDRELKGVMSANGEWSGLVWMWRIKCEYEYKGTKYAVTPKVGWSSFGSKEEALKYLDKRIAQSGECRLRINPQVPRQTELFGEDIVDKVFF